MDAPAQRTHPLTRLPRLALGISRGMASRRPKSIDPPNERVPLLVESRVVVY